MNKLSKYTLMTSLIAGVSLQAAVDARSSAEENRFFPVELPSSGQTSNIISVEQEGMPFRALSNQLLDLRQAGWPGWKEDFGGSYEDYDSQKMPDEGDVQLYRTTAPKADYVAAHVLAFADEDPGLGDRLTLRIGRWLGGAAVNSQVLRYDFSAEVPRRKDPQLIRIPLSEAFAQDVEGPIFDIELAKEIRLARRKPDPSRYRWMPLGLPSGVKIQAITLEKSPLQMEVETPALAGTFVQPERAELQIKLTNITSLPQSFMLTLQSGEYPSRQEEGEIPPGESGVYTLSLPTQDLGHHFYRLELKDGKGNPLLARNGSWMLLSAKQWKNLPPFALGAGRNGIHFSPQNPKMAATLLNRLGIRYANVLGDGKAIPYEERRDHGLLNGYEFTWRPSNLRRKESLPEKFAEFLQNNPDGYRTVMLLHEDSISGSHSIRVPDLFVDRPPYELNEQEKERFLTLRNLITESAAWFRKEHPDVKIMIGNGNLGVREELYRSKLPPESFDLAGNECGSFARAPEAQPPDNIAANASLWMDRQMLDSYGYKDKQVGQGWEVYYPSTNPGNLDLRTHADYSVRHRLHSLVWGVPKVSGGGLYDYGNSYALGNWGSSGYYTPRPRPMPKPAAHAVAVLARALDDVTYRDFVETGSDSAYLLRFVSPTGRQVLPFWVMRGKREFLLSLKGQGDIKWMTPQGNILPLDIDNESRIRLSASASPAYLLLPPGVEVFSVKPGEPVHDPVAPPKGATLLSSLGSQAEWGEHGWHVVAERSLLLENYNPLTPRRKGDFSIETGKDERTGEDVLYIAPRPLRQGKATMPMYSELEHARGILLPGEPEEIGIMVEGNSGWGRLIFELEDASGQRWTSIGAQAQQGKAEWMEDWLGKDAAQAYQPGMISDWNTEDPWGQSQINFDGRRYVSFPLPGQYPGEGYHWPSNSQWNWDKDGRVHYPLTLKKVIIQLPEKVLYLNRFAPPLKKQISLMGVYTAKTNRYEPKNKPFRYIEAYQMRHY